MARRYGRLTLLVYSSLLLAVMVLGLPYWLFRMVVSGRYRAGLAGRLGWLTTGLRDACAGRDLLWLHAVSVGEVLAATRLVADLHQALPGWVIAVSTTTETGQTLARQRFAGSPVFYLPLDFAFLMRRYLRLLRPRMVILMESELWPNLIHECAKAGIPLAVANARISDRSFPRYLRLKRLWLPLLRDVSLFLAQSEETAHRLRAIGVPPGQIRIVGNLKYDVLTPKQSVMSELIAQTAAGRSIVVAGSTLGGEPLDEEILLIQAWEGTLRKQGTLLVLAPRHPPRFDLVYSVAVEFPTLRATELLAGKGKNDGYSVIQKTDEREVVEIIVLDTIGDLASLYSLATVAFVGGSLVARGGHNPLEPAQFGVPVVMGPFYENFRDVVETMKAADAIRIVPNKDALEAAFADLLTHPDEARALGELGRRVFEEQQGATARVVAELLRLLR